MCGLEQLGERMSLGRTGPKYSSRNHLIREVHVQSREISQLARDTTYTGIPEVNLTLSQLTALILKVRLLE